LTVLLAAALALVEGPAAPVAAQDAQPLGARVTQVWPRWNEPAAPTPAALLPDTATSNDGQVFAMSVVGSLTGTGAGILFGAVACWEDRCGNGDYDALTGAFFGALLGSALGSAAMACSVRHESGCFPHALPWAFLGTVAAVAGSAAIASGGRAGPGVYLAFPLIQGLVTARAIL
jgi:hypothetical protein